MILLRLRDKQLHAQWVIDVGGVGDYDDAIEASLVQHRDGSYLPVRTNQQGQG